MKYIQTYNESIKYQYFSSDDINDINDIFQDIIDKYDLELDYYANKNTYYISYYNVFGFSKELTTNMDYVKEIVIDINVSDREKVIEDIDQVINRYKSMGYDAIRSYPLILPLQSIEHHLLIKIKKFDRIYSPR